MRKNKQRWQRTLVAIAAILAFLFGAVTVGHLRTLPAAAQSNAIQLAESGRQLYHSGQYQKALSVWQQAAEAFVAKGDRLNQAMALNNLSLSAQHLGQWTAAETATRQSLEILRRQNSNPTQQRLLAASLDSYAQLQFATGRPTVALDLWQEPPNPTIASTTPSESPPATSTKPEPNKNSASTPVPAPPCYRSWAKTAIAAN
ncbi:tetratricopeptide repeat protein [Synechococcus sp. PCC 7336]|uniref:tetratricopeptide repeat protein n=1 Tax=Synechococcus sp. PCC 7336 TaxID=195250 RepID=UPI00034D564E|nr:tetratricopeptide repeat protein [Synechococcus sp. PCC 7336]